MNLLYLIWAAWTVRHRKTTHAEAIEIQVNGANKTVPLHYVSSRVSKLTLWTTFLLLWISAPVLLQHFSDVPHFAAWILLYLLIGAVVFWRLWGETLILGRFRCPQCLEVLPKLAEKHSPVKPHQYYCSRCGIAWESFGNATEPEIAP